MQTYRPEIPIVAQYAAATVIGLGVTGFSVVRYLRARGLQLTVMDSRAEPPIAKRLSRQFPEVNLLTGEFKFENFQPNHLLVVSPGVSLAHPALRQAKKAGAHLIGDIELFVQENTKPIIAITGSNGKSTVTTLVGEMCRCGGLKTLVAGNIGLPVLDALTDQIDYQVAVLELSSFQLETTSNLAANAAAILNVSADHMDRYDSMGDYLLAKARILRGAKQVVLPRHDEQLGQLGNVGKQLSFALDAPENEDEFGIERKSNLVWLYKGKQRLLKAKEIPLLGFHNVKNVLAALALVDFLNIPLHLLLSAIKSFSGLPHRMQTVVNCAGVTWVNDSKATNIGATSTALKNLEKEVYWIAGGQGKGADFGALREAISDKVKRLILFGEDAAKIESALKDLVPVQRVKTMQQAVELAGREATVDSVVLFSPACASFDMYQNFEHRGDDFVRCVRAWTQQGVS